MEEVKKDNDTVQIGIKTTRWFRRKLKRYALDHNTTVTQLTVEYWDQLLARYEQGREGDE